MISLRIAAFLGDLAASTALALVSPMDVKRGMRGSVAGPALAGFDIVLVSQIVDLGGSNKFDSKLLESSRY